MDEREKLVSERVVNELARQLWLAEGNSDRDGIVVTDLYMPEDPYVNFPWNRLRPKARQMLTAIAPLIRAEARAEALEEAARVAQDPKLGVSDWRYKDTVASAIRALKEG